MLILLNILYGAALFALFVGVLYAPVALIIWGIRRWYGSHNLRTLPWRRRRAALGLALLWEAGFSKLSLGKKIVGFSVLLSVLFVVFLLLLRAMTCSWTLEDSIVLNLRVARTAWLRDDCPRPVDPERYLPKSSSLTGFVYAGSFVVKDPDLESRTQGLIKERTCHGLFALKDSSLPSTYVIATTGEVIALESSGQVRLVRTE